MADKVNINHDVITGEVIITAQLEAGESVDDFIKYLVVQRALNKITCDYENKSALDIINELAEKYDLKED